MPTNPQITSPKILVIDDNTDLLQTIARVLRAEQMGEPICCSDPREAQELCRTQSPAVILMDLTMPHITGQQLLRTLVDEFPDSPLIVLTATDDVDTAVACIKGGATDYLVKPVEFSRLIASVSRALQHRELRSENRRLRELVRDPRLQHPEHFAEIISEDPAMQAIFRYVEAIAPSFEPALIIGETGVGKELFARAIHRASKRPGTLHAVNVAGIDEQVFADTLFGHVKGAFTGANQSRAGMIEQANEGTLFLDEVGDVGLDMQTKLLRLLETRDYFPLGSDTPCRCCCRIIAATNKNLRLAMQAGHFRPDLYYRLHAHLIRIPPLRERYGDLPALVDSFIAEASDALGKKPPTAPPELTIHLATYPFPGNVRELRAMVFDAVAQHSGGVLSLATFHRRMDQGDTLGETRSSDDTNFLMAKQDGTLPTLQQATDALIAAALARTEGNQGAAARLLGISRRTVNRHLASQSSEDQ